MTYYIAIEGGDGTGKATQSQLLLSYFSSKNIKATRVEVPYNDGYTYDLIYKCLKNGIAKKCPTIFQIIHFCNKYGFQSYVLPNLQQEYEVIIFDRWKLSSVVYGTVTNANEFFVKKASNLLIEPDITIVLTTPNKRQDLRDDYEKDTTLQTKVRCLYDDLARQDTTGKLFSIDAVGSIESIHAKICHIIQTHLNFSKKKV